MDLLTDQEAREQYRLLSLPQWRVSGKGPPFLKLGRRVFYERAALEGWMREQQRTSTSDPGRRAA